MDSKNISCGGAIFILLAGILVFVLIVMPVGNVVSTLVEAIIPAQYKSLRMFLEETLFFIALGSIIAIPVLIIGYQEFRKSAKKSPWPAFAASKHLTFVPGKFFGHSPFITGTYRHHHLKLETFIKTQEEQSGLYTRLAVSVNVPEHDSPQNESHFSGEQVSHKDAINLLHPASPDYILKGANLKGYITDYIVAQTVYVCHEREGEENDSEYLEYLFDLLSDLAEAYSAVVPLGGEAVPFLKNMLARHYHELIVAELLRNIANKTTEQLEDRIIQALCPSCLTRCEAHQVELSSSEHITYYGCRTCSRSRELLEGRVVAVLDSWMDAELVQRNGTWRVNWLARQSLFDFDEVEIIRATDEFRRSRYKDVPCIVGADCDLFKNSLRILESTFGAIHIVTRSNSNE